MMTKLIRTRLACLAAAIAMAAAGTLWGLHDTWKCIQALELRLTRAHLESFRLAEDFQNRLHNLNSAMLRFAATRAHSAWVEFAQASTNLDRWIDQYDPRTNPKTILTTEPEQNYFRQLNDGYDVYLKSARAVGTNDHPALASGTAYSQLSEFEEHSQRLLGLSIQLADAHREAEQAFLVTVHDSLRHLRLFLMGGVLVSLVLVGVLAAVVYRDAIAPLRTKLVQSEALLLRQEKLATLGTLAAGIAHEIRNPLTSIKDRLYTLGKHVRGNDAASGDRMVIEGEITRLEQIVQNVLKFARPSDPEMKLISGSQLLEEVHRLMGSTTEGGQVKLLLEASDDFRVMGDVGHLKQVLINLIRNGFEAVEGEGTVILGMKTGEMLLKGVNQRVAIFEVRDTGRGITAEVEKRLFDPFFTTKDSGTGLGLSMAARIVEKHGGQLQYQTKVGMGTTFGVVLPLVS